MGYGEAKQALFEKADAMFGEARERRRQWADTPEAVEEILQAGAAKARGKAREVLSRAQVACGLK